MRLTPLELQKRDYDATQLGTGGLKGEHVKVLVGDPSKPEFYSVRLFVPPRTTIRRTRIAVIAWPPW